MKAETTANKAQNAASTVKKKANETATGAKRTAKQVHADGQALGRKLGKSGRQAYNNAQQLADSVQDVQSQLSDALSHQAKTRPYIALGAAAGLGFVLAGGLTVRLTSKLVGLGGRMLVSAAMKNLLDPSA